MKIIKKYSQEKLQSNVVDSTDEEEMRMFQSLLITVVLFLTIVVFCGFLNEKTINLPTEVALLFAGLLISIVVLGLQNTGMIERAGEALPEYLLDDFLVKGVLCFMLFAGACKLRFCDLKSQIKL